MSHRNEPACDVHIMTLFFAGSFTVSLVIDFGAHGIGGKCLGILMIHRPTLGCDHWWKFVHTECYHEVIFILRASIENV